MAAELRIPPAVADFAQCAWLSDNLHGTTVSPMQRQVAAELRAMGARPIPCPPTCMHVSI
jgi:hypothetical protein